jgi:ABC-2 type transport system ATP-binding protein
LRAEGRAVLVSTHIIDSAEENWDATFIMQNGKVARECRRSEVSGGSLEEIYFSIIGGSGA